MTHNIRNLGFISVNSLCLFWLLYPPKDGIFSPFLKKCKYFIKYKYFTAEGQQIQPKTAFFCAVHGLSLYCCQLVTASASIYDRPPTVISMSHIVSINKHVISRASACGHLNNCDIVAGPTT